MFLEGKEFKSIWNVAHLWAGYDPESTDPNALPVEVRDHVHWLIVGHFRGELPLRKKWVRIDISDDSILNNFLCIPAWLKLKRCLYKNAFDKTFLDSLRIARGELIRWCQKEFRTPPPFWMPETINGESPKNNDDDGDTSWYDSLADKDKQRITMLEIAKQLWAQDQTLGYRDIYDHEALAKYGYKNKFSLEVFKKWASRFAPEAAKSPGRRSQSKN
ncbi:MAG: hypothetical protein ACYCTY_16595 [Sulfuricella sp.]